MRDESLGQINRFIIVIGAMTIAFAALAAILVTWGAPEAAIDRIADFAGFLHRHNDRDTKTIITLGAAVIVFLMLTVIVVEIAPASSQTMAVRNVRSGDAVITTSQIAARIDAEALTMRDIAACRSVVSRRGKRVDVMLDLHVNPGANLAQTADAACRAAQALVEQRLGIELGAPPRARLHYRELRLGKDATHATDPATGWERPAGQQSIAQPEEDRDQRGTTDAPEAT